MTITAQIEEAARRHAPRLHLVREHVKRTAEHITYETKTQEAADMAVHGLSTAIVDVFQVAAEDVVGLMAVTGNLDEIRKNYNRLALLISALEAR